MLRDSIDEKLREGITRIDGRRYMEAPKQRYGVEVLLLNSSLGFLSVEALRAAGAVFASREQKPCPAFHVTALETTGSQAAIAQLVPKENYEAIVEDYACADTRGMQWHSFAPAGERTPVSERTVPIGERKDGDVVPENVVNKVKSRLSTLAKDPRQLRPPVEDGMSRLALAKLIQAPIGPSGPELPQPERDDHLNARADIVVCQLIDSGGLGEGILPILSYCHEALMKPNGKVSV